jgi:NAD(P)-dependent dehydrogenase (short-subunit alcohol dehydrogenase family)
MVDTLPYSKYMNLKNKIAIVTGANRGLGKEVVNQLLQKEMIIYAAMRSKKDYHLFRKEINDKRVIPFVLDITNQKNLNFLKEEVLNKFGKIDVLINNAGIYIDNPTNIGIDVFASASSDFLKTLEVNLIGSYNMIKTFLPIMIQNNYGRIVNVSSGLGRLSEINTSGMFYKISKLALNGLTLAFSKEVNHSNILINSVCPGWIRTEMGGKEAVRTVYEGAKGIVLAAIFPENGPNGKFFRDNKELNFCKK